MSRTLTTTPGLFRAFADATRLRILNLLADGELCVCELCSALGEGQPKISRHLAYLRRVDLVTVRKKGRWKFYRIAKNPPALQQRLLRCVRSCLREMDVLQRDLTRLRTRGKRATCE